MQKEINDEIWENKDIRSARMNAVNGARDLVAAFTNAGFYKTKEEAFDDFHAFKNMVFDYIYADMKQHVNTEFRTEQLPETLNDCCEKCGNTFTDGEKAFQARNPDDKKWCYRCKKEAGLVKSN